MTITDVSNVTTAIGNASTTAFSTVFIFFASSDLVVTLDAVTQVLDTDYTVTGGSGAVGTVTFTTAPGSSVAIVIERVVAYEQQTDFENFDGNPADVTEDQFDLVVMQTQQLRDAIDRSITVPVGTSGFDGELTLTSNGLKFLQLKTDLSGFQFTTALDTSQSAISTYGETLIDDANAAEARQTLLLPAQSASKRGAVLVQNGTDDGYEQIDSQGISGQVMTSNGPDALPSFQSRAWVTIRNVTISTDASVEFQTGVSSVDLTLYDEFRIKVVDYVPATDNSNLDLALSADGGSTPISCETYSDHGLSSSAALNAFVSAADVAPTLAFTVGSATGEVLNLDIVFPNLNSALYKTVQWIGSQYSSDGHSVTIQGGIVAPSTSIVNSITISASSGNMTSGSVILQGRNF